MTTLDYPRVSGANVINNQTRPLLMPQNEQPIEYAEAQPA